MLRGFFLGSVLCLAAAGAAPFGGGVDVVECATPTGCVAGNASLATNLSSLDIDGSARFETVFRFESVDNLMAFENAPFLHAPRYGGFCAWALASSNRTDWGRSKMGPAIDLKSWRLASPARGAPPALYGFGGPEGAERFVAGLPGTMQRADARWAGWWGLHGTEPPYAVSGGPFNTACFDGAPAGAAPAGAGAAAGGREHARDCSVDPQPLPPP